MSNSPARSTTASLPLQKTGAWKPWKWKVMNLSRYIGPEIEMPQQSPPTSHQHPPPNSPTSLNVSTSTLIPNATTAGISLSNSTPSEIYTSTLLPTGCSATHNSATMLNASYIFHPASNWK